MPWLKALVQLFQIFSTLLLKWGHVGSLGLLREQKGETEALFISLISTSKMLGIFTAPSWLLEAGSPSCPEASPPSLSGYSALT